MGIAELFATVKLVLKFWDSVEALVKMLQSTPFEKQEKLRNELNNAFKLAKENGDPSAISRLINRP